MVDIVLECENKVFSTDLQKQIEKYVPNAVFNAQFPDVIITDTNNVFAQMRQKYPSTPIIILTEQSDTLSDKLNIFIKKPFKLMLFLDVLQAANNQLNHSADGYLYFNDFILKPSKKELQDKLLNKTFKLTEKEVDILRYLYKNTDAFVTKTDLQTNVWQYNQNVTTHTVETHIYRLRQKVENAKRTLILIDNGRYRLCMES